MPKPDPGVPTRHMQAVLDQYLAFGAPPLMSVGPETARQLPTIAEAVRAVLGRSVTSRAVTPYPEPVGEVSHLLLEGPGGELLIRTYTPDSEGPFPVVLYFHGGGWVIGSIGAADDTCRALCNLTGAIVASVAYRQAPEHLFPSAVEDAFAAYHWLRDNAGVLGGDPERIALAGEGAGGNLATVVAILARDRDVPPAVHQLLVYPITSCDFETPSYRDYGDARPLGAESMLWFWAQYLPNETERLNPLASPLLADLAGLPPATVITAEIDPLASEGRAYAERLRTAGVPVEARHYDGVTHEFFGMFSVVPEAKDALELAARRLTEAFRQAASPVRVVE
jgi:acetyl esterase